MNLNAWQLAVMEKLVQEHLESFRDVPSFTNTAYFGGLEALLAKLKAAEHCGAVQLNRRR